MAEQPKYIRVELPDDYAGTLSKPAANYSGKQRKGKRMPKSAGTLNNVTAIAGKRGRKAEFNAADWKMDIGVENALDVTEEMLSAVEKYAEKSKVKLAVDALNPANFSKDNEAANKYRANRFGAFKRAAIAANGKDSTYELVTATNSEKNHIWALVRNS